MPASVLTRNYMLSVPRDIREQAGWKPGTRLAFIRRGDVYELVPVPDAAEVRGLMKGADPTGYRDRGDRS